MDSKPIDKSRDTLGLLVRDKMVTLAPLKLRSLPDNLQKFRWRMHTSLPFPFPSASSFHRKISVHGTTYEVSIHNHLNRLIRQTGGENAAPYFEVSLVDERIPREVGADISASWETLQSVSIFTESTEYHSPDEAFRAANKKVLHCLEWLASFLATCQRAAPYLSSWLVYPISLFDVGVVYHNVDGLCSKTGRWCPLSSALSASVGRQLKQPLFTMDVPQCDNQDTPMEVANELLAEALMSVFRGMPRVAVLNSYTAVESLANVVFSKMRIAQLTSEGVDFEEAELLAEDERKRHRTEPNFLFHRGIRSVSGRSIFDEDQPLYDSLIDTHKLRNRIAHIGFKPSNEVARSSHKTCCEAVTWLAKVSGFPTKPLLPETYSPGLRAAFKDTQARSMSERELLVHLLKLTEDIPDRSTADQPSRLANLRTEAAADRDIEKRIQEGS